MFLMWDRKERVESWMTPTLRTSGGGEMEHLSTTRARSPTFLNSDAGATTKSSVLLHLSLNRFVVIHNLSSCRQLTSCVGGIDVLFFNCS